MLLSVIIGIASGYIYGLFFAAQQKRVFCIDNKNVRYHFATIVLLTVLRFSFFAIVSFYVLHLPSINPILVLLLFIAVFWLSTFRRMHKNERC